MYDKVADYIHVERGIIPRDVCERILANITSQKWEPNTWYDPATNRVYSESALEPDLLRATPDIQLTLEPAINAAAVRYCEKYTYKDSRKTSQILTRFCSVRFNRYGRGQVMRKHHDHIHTIFDGNEKGIPVLSFVGNLNENYSGGQLSFFNGETEVSMRTGDICMFPSCFLYPHEAKEVTEGTRYSFSLWGW
jgi:hypothetical protein